MENVEKEKSRNNFHKVCLILIFWWASLCYLLLPKTMGPLVKVMDDTLPQHDLLVEHIPFGISIIFRFPCWNLLGDDMCESTALIVTSGFDDFRWKLDLRDDFFLRDKHSLRKAAKRKSERKQFQCKLTPKNKVILYKQKCTAAQQSLGIWWKRLMLHFLFDCILCLAIIGNHHLGGSFFYAIWK